jgi:acyl dehydratase
MTTLSDDQLDLMVDELRERIGRKFDVKLIDSVATGDVIRRFALGFGDDNPLYVDPDYAAGTRWNGQIAPPSYLVTAGHSVAHGLPGVHALFAGVDIEFRRPVRAGDAITAVGELSSVEEREGRYAGRSFKQTYTSEFVAGGSTVAVIKRYSIRTVRDHAASGGKYAAIERATYTPEEIEDIQARYLAEADARRGSKKLDLATVSVGDRLPTLLKGPLTVSDVICWLVGVGEGIFVRSSRQWFEFLERHPKGAVLNEYGVPDSPERVHWEDDMAAKIGMPAPFDYGSQRIAWIGHAVTDWMGDHAWVRRLAVQLRAPNNVGDLTTVSGTVESVDAERGEAEVAVECRDQRGRVTATGTAHVATYDEVRGG